MAVSGGWMNVIETRQLAKHYGRVRSLDCLDLDVPQGSATVLVGANGAGKSTTIQMLMNLIVPTSGSATVLGHDSRKLDGPVFQTIGYATENQVLPSYMKLPAWFSYLRGLYPGWDPSLEAQLRQRFDLPETRRLRSLSRGERMKACVAAAMSYRPPLLVMDEPLSGLDPLSRMEVVRALKEQAPDCSMLISSHDLSEIDRVASHIAVLHKGKLVLQEPTSSLAARFRLVTVQLPGRDPVENLPAEWLNSERLPGQLQFDHSAAADGDPAVIAQVRARFGTEAVVTVEPMNLTAIGGSVMRAAGQAALPGQKVAA